jgi:hypothetical protein
MSDLHQEAEALLKIMVASLNTLKRKKKPTPKG